MLPMIPMVLKFLSIKKYIPLLIKHWKMVLIVVLSTVILYQNTFETRLFFGSNTIPYLEAELLKANTNLQTCKAGNDKLSLAIDKQNEEFSALNDELKKKQREFDQKFADILNRKPVIAPQTPAINTCNELVDYIKTMNIDWE